MNYVCADIHGRWDKYQAMLEDLNLGEDDKLYILGDVIDRGEDGIRILQDIMKRGNIFLFIGNHELFLYYCIQCDDEEWTESWMRNGGRPTAQRFLELDDGEQDAILRLIAEFLRCHSRPQRGGEALLPGARLPGPALHGPAGAGAGHGRG